MMFDGQNSRRTFRGLRIAVLAAAILPLTSSIIHAAAPSASVVSVQPTRVADVILLAGGFNAGLRQNMVCRVTRDAVEIAEVLLVDLRPTCSAALILNVAPRQAIRAGDAVSIKVLKT